MSADGDPLVTVLLPAYNAGEYLGAAVNSILEQDFSSFELLVLDDGSTDGSVEALLSSVVDPRLRVVRQQNQGLSAALNNGITAARGTLLARMDADDISLPGRLSAQASFLEANRDVVLVGGQIDRIVGHEVDSASVFPTVHRDIVKGLLAGRHVLCHPAVMFRTHTVRAVGGYWSYGLSEDWDLFLRLSEVGRLANLDSKVLRYRYHSDGINAKSMTAVRRNIELAVANYALRSRGLPELDPATFWASVGPLKRLAIAARTRSLTSYRAALRAKRDGRRVTALSHLLVSAALWPRQALYRLLG